MIHLLRRWRVLRARVEEPLAQGVTTLLLLGVALAPLVILAVDLFDVEGGSRAIASLFSLRIAGLGATTLLLGLAVTSVALLIGVPLGALIGKMDIIGRRAVFWVHVFPVFLPPFLLALGWFYLLGRQGPWGSVTTSRLLFGPVGVIAVLGLAFSPIVTALTVLALRGVDASLEESARTVARPGRVVLSILLPIVRPSISLGALLVFSLSISEIGVPMFLRTRTYPAMVFSRLGGVRYAPAEAFALVLPLLVLAMALWAIERRLIGRASFAALSLRAPVRAPLPLGRWRRGASVIVWAFALLSSSPIVILAWRAGRVGLGALGARMGSSVTTSLLSSALAATAITALGIVLGHALARRRRGSALGDGVAMLTFIIPAALLGVGLVALWNRDATQPIYTSVAILVLGLVARYAIVGIRTIASTVVLTSPSVEEAAAVFGARYLRRLAYVVIPMHARGIVGAWFLAMVFCLRDLETVVVFYPPGLDPLPVRIFTLEANGAPAEVAALAILHVGLTAAVLALGGILLGAFGGRRRSG